MIRLNPVYCLIVINLLASLSAANYTLKSLYVIFRHGDRTPNAYPGESYPTDPYKNNPFYPIGFGGLTNQGKDRLYNFGTFLRDRYDEFLGEVYWPSDVKALSTDTKRTKMSLGLVLAALYPPKDKQVWQKDLKWQPIPFDYTHNENNHHFLYYECPIYKKELEQFQNSEEYKKAASQYTEFLKNLTYFTGAEVNNTQFVFFLYHTLTAQSSMNLPLPEWTKAYYPDGLVINTTLFQYNVDSYTETLKRLNGGMTLSKILDDILNTVNASSTDSPKVHLYSAHECNIAGILQTLYLWKNIIPQYTSSVIFELYNKNSKYFIKVLYYKGIPSEYEELQIPGCSKLCPLEELIELLKPYIPNNAKEECFGSNSSQSKLSGPFLRRD